MWWQMYKLTYINRNTVNDVTYFYNLEDVWKKIKEGIIQDNLDNSLEDFIADKSYCFAEDLIDLQIGQMMVLPYINGDGDYGALIIEKIKKDNENTTED